MDDKCKLRIDMIKLWSCHIFYISDYIISSVAKIDNLQLIEERLEQNQNDIGNLFGNVYGRYNGNRFSELLKENISLEIEFINSTIKGEIEESVSHNLRWHMGIIKIVDFLSAIDDNFDRPYLRGLFFDHLHLTEEYLMTRIHKDYSNEIKSFDSLYSQVLLIANTLSYIMSYRIND